METEDPKSKKFELIIALVLAFFAAASAINGLYADKFGEDEMIAHNRYNQQYSWFQSKSIKQILAENQRDMLVGLLKAGLVKAENTQSLDSTIAHLNQEIARYKKEKREIMLGSSKVGKENWVQDIDGELGKVIGAEEYEEITEKLGIAGDDFDTGSLLLNLCLVFGAIAIILQAHLQRVVFFWMMVVSGSFGCYFTFIAWLKCVAVVG
ncbi:MAG: DUF4337 domain-containing protein [Cytophagales bacterium]